jgi:hypothetical protein
MGLKQSQNEEDITEWIDHLNSKCPDEEKLPFYIRWYEDLKFEIIYWWENSIIYPIKSFLKGIDNLWRWRKIIWKDRWWDYYYLLEILRFKLKDMEEHWGKDTHYVKDYEEKESLKKLIEDLEWMIDDTNEFEDGYMDEYKKRSKRFFGRLDRGHRKLWD